MIALWSGRTARERWLIAIAAAMSALLLVSVAAHGLGLARRAAIDRVAQAEADYAAVKASAARVRGKAALADASPPLDRLRAGLVAAGLTAKLEVRDSRVHVAIDAARGPVLLRWLGSAEASRLVAARAALRRNSDGTVAFEGDFTAARR